MTSEEAPLPSRAQSEAEAKGRRTKDGPENGSASSSEHIGLSDSMSSDLDINTADAISDPQTLHRKESILACKLRVKRRMERMRRNSKIRKLPKHTSGSQWYQVVKGRITMLNKQFSSQFNLIFISLELSWRWLLLSYFITIFLLALVLAGLFEAGHCVDQLDFDVVYLIVAQQLMTGPSFIEMTDKDFIELDSGCWFLAFISSCCTLFLQAFVLSMAVRKFMKPRSAIAFSKKLCFNSRNGIPCLQTRMMNLRGNLISDLQIRASWSYPVKTLEGEQHWRIETLNFAGPLFIKLPVTWTHYIDESSPLFEPYFKDQKIQGRLYMEVIGYDHVLCEEVHTTWAFQLPEDTAPYCRFADMVVKSFQESVQDKTFKPMLEMGNFDAVQEMPRAREMLQRLSCRCAFDLESSANDMESERERQALLKLSTAARSLQDDRETGSSLCAGVTESLAAAAASPAMDAPQALHGSSLSQPSDTLTTELDSSAPNAPSTNNDAQAWSEPQSQRAEGWRAQHDQGAVEETEHEV